MVTYNATQYTATDEDPFSMEEGDLAGDCLERIARARSWGVTSLTKTSIIRYCLVTMVTIMFYLVTIVIIRYYLVTMVTSGVNHSCDHMEAWYVQL